MLSRQNSHKSTHMHTHMLVQTDSTLSLPSQHYPWQPHRHGTLQHTPPKTLQHCLKHRPSVERQFLLPLCTWAQNAAPRDNKISIYVGTPPQKKIIVKLLPTPNDLPVLYNKKAILLQYSLLRQQPKKLKMSTLQNCIYYYHHIFHPIYIITFFQV